MSENAESLVLELLRKIRLEQQEMHIEIQELKARATAVDEHLGGLMMSVAGVNAPIDRVDERLARIERRLELTDAK